MRNIYFNTDNKMKKTCVYIYEYRFGIIHYLLYSDTRVRGGEPSSSGGVTGIIFIISGVGGGGPGGARGPGGSADIGVLGASRGERLRSSRLEWLGAFSSSDHLT